VDRTSIPELLLDNVPEFLFWLGGGAGRSHDRRHQVSPNARGWRGVRLGSRTVHYDERVAILYALAVGAQATELTWSSRTGCGCCRPSR